MGDFGTDPAAEQPPEPTPPPGPEPSDRVDPARTRIRQVVVHYVPIVTWLPAYPADWRRADMVAALTSWGVMVPVALAYAALAGVPPEYGLITAFAALTAYAIFGTSRHLKITTSSTMAIMSAVGRRPARGRRRGPLPRADRGPRARGRGDPPGGRDRSPRLHRRLPGQVRRDRVHLRPGDHDHHRPAAEAPRRAQRRSTARSSRCRCSGRQPARHQPVDPRGRGRRPGPHPRAAADLPEDPGAARRPRARHHRRGGVRPGGPRRQRRRRDPDGDPDPGAPAESHLHPRLRSRRRAAGIVFLAVGESLGAGRASRRGTSTRSTPTRSSSRSARRTSRPGCSGASPWMPASRSRPRPSRRAPLAALLDRDGGARPRDGASAGPPVRICRTRCSARSSSRRS